MIGFIPVLLESAGGRWRDRWCVMYYYSVLAEFSAYFAEITDVYAKGP